MNEATQQTARTMCPMNCHPTFCGMTVTTENNRLIDVTGDQENPDSAGFLCVRGRASQEIMDNPKRLLKPLARDRRNGGDWQEIEWDEAFDRIVASMQRVGRESVAVWPCHGSIANDYGVFANMFLALRFANMYGCQWWDASMICWGLGGFGVGLTGPMEINTKEDMSAHADLIVQWGSNQASQPNTARHIAAAKKRGAKVVAIDVRKSDACRAAHDHFMVRPGTDAALALAMMHVIINEDLYDSAFVDQHTVGFDALKAHVQSFTPDWAAGVCGVGADHIIDFAREYAATDRAMILLSGSSMYKDQHGWQASRAISCLAPLTGKLGKPGTGYGPRHAGEAHGAGLSNIMNIEARPPGDYVPNQMPAIIEAMTGGRIRTLLLFGSDFTSSFADAGRLKKALNEMDLVVAHDLFMNETIRNHADIVLPGTTWLEDLGVKGTTTHMYLMDRILEPAGEARSMTDIVRTLAARFDIEDFYPWHEDGGHIDAVLDHPATGHATVESLRAAGGIAPFNVSHVGHPDLKFPTPSGKVEFYSERAAEVGLPALPSFQPRSDATYPLELRMGRTINHFHAFYDGGRALPSLVHRDKGPLLWISEADADARGITDGIAVQMRNDRGSFDARASVTDKVPAGTLWIHDGWSGLNDLTNGERALSDEATQLFPFSTGQCAYDAFVEVVAV